MIKSKILMFVPGYTSSKPWHFYCIKNSTLSVGSITDDIQNLRKILDRTNPSTPVDFDRLANVLIALGERISRSDKVY